MAPTRPATGGRPKNSWTSSRHRRLVRLYTLTMLSKKEIEMVLTLENFKTRYLYEGDLLRFLILLLLSNSESDIQKKLRALFPRDYAKEFRTYHPSNKTLMLQRFERVRRHRTRRLVTAQNGFKSSNGQPKASQDALSPSQKPSIFFKDQSTAFRSYEDCSHILAYENSSESQLVNPSLLLLDGSAIAEVAATIQASAAATATASQLHDESSSDTPLMESKLAISRSTSFRSSVPSLHSLGERLLNHSSSSIRHVYSVLRYSSTSSWTSAPSWRSSFLSFNGSMKPPAFPGPPFPTSERPASPTNLDSSKSKSLKSKLFPQRTKQAHPMARSKAPDHLPSDEQCVWHELVDENQLAIWSGRPEVHSMSLTIRYCCRYYYCASEPEIFHGPRHL
jgi:hypothetical protein